MRSEIAACGRMRSSATTVAFVAAPAILWLITDNQPSVGNQTDSDKDIAQFYDRLRSDARFKDVLRQVHFLP